MTIKEERWILEKAEANNVLFYASARIGLKWLIRIVGDDFARITYHCCSTKKCLLDDKSVIEKQSMPVMSFS